MSKNQSPLVRQNGGSKFVVKKNSRRRVRKSDEIRTNTGNHNHNDKAVLIDMDDGVFWRNECVFWKNEGVFWKNDGVFWENGGVSWKAAAFFG